MNTGSIFTFFTEFQFLTQIAYFAKALAHGNAIALEHGRFSALSHFWNIWCFFRRFFAHNLSNVNTDSLLTCFKKFKFLAQIEYFAKAIAHARCLIFNIVLFLEYLVFFRAVFCTELLQCEYRIYFDMLSGI